MIKSISYKQEEIISNILKLHCMSDQIDLDPTYGRGNFYKKAIKEPIHRFDITPLYDYVLPYDSTNLPFENSYLNTIIFDPPFLATKGKSLKENKNNNIINKRFTVYPTEKELHNYYYKSLLEFERILKYKGILIFKCQDKVSSGTQYMSHLFIMNKAIETGFYIKDFFILLAKNRLVAQWQLKNQKHVRKFHSYFLVLQKLDKKVTYID